MDHLRCVVERITYQNAQNGYSVIKCRVKGRCSSSGRAFSADRSGSGDYSDLVTVVGSMPDVHVGSVLELGGSWRVDPKYGRQFSKEKLSGEDGAASSECPDDIEAKPERAIYLPPFFFSEMGVVRRMSAILKNREGIHVNAQGLSERISRKTRMHYDQIQMQAIVDAVTSKILILTGGPGTGKTTTTLGIITAFREAGAKILLAAPATR